MDIGLLLSISYFGGMLFLLIFGGVAKKRGCWIAGGIMCGLLVTYLLLTIISVIVKNIL